MKKSKTVKKAFFKEICQKCSFVKGKKFQKVAVTVVLVLVLGYMVKVVFLAAFVNWRPISRITLIKNMEKQVGETTLNTLIEKSLIYQEASKQKIVISKEEIQNEITAIEEILQVQNITLDQALESRGQTREELEEQIKFSKIIEIILADKITVSDEEISEYFKTNRAYFDTKATLDDVKADIENEIAQQKMSDEYTIWITEVKAKAKIINLLKF